MLNIFLIVPCCILLSPLR